MRTPGKAASRSPTEFLFKRGLVIILIEVVLYYLVWADSYPSFLFLQVLFAIGACMILLSVACHLSYWLIGALGALIVFGHNMLAPINFLPGESGYLLWTMLLDPGDLGQIGGLTVDLSYPVLPWFGVILLGYFAGPLYAPSTGPAERRRMLIAFGSGCLALLLVLRGFNIYGETLPWGTQDTTIRTIMDLLNFTKYPPSLSFLLVTLGSGLWLLAFFDSLKRQNLLTSTLQEFGSVPMFIYVLLLYVLLAAYWVLYGIFGPTHGVRFGFSSLSWVWVGFVVLALVHYPLARAFAHYKHNHKQAQPWLELPVMRQL